MSLPNPVYDHIQERIDEWNRTGGYPPATDWPTRVNDAYHLGWRDSQLAMRRSAEGARALRPTLWQRFRRRFLRP